METTRSGREADVGAGLRHNDLPSTITQDLQSLDSNENAQISTDADNTGSALDVANYIDEDYILAPSPTSYCTVEVPFEYEDNTDNPVRGSTNNQDGDSTDNQDGGNTDNLDEGSPDNLDEGSVNKLRAFVEYLDSDCSADSDNARDTEETFSNNESTKDTLHDTLKHLGELSIDELPPVEHNHVEVKPEECDLIGKVGMSLGKLVLVETIPNKPALDIDTLLFLDTGKRPLGLIFDVIGPVTHPLYAIRFNTEDEIKALNLKEGMSVYCAPNTEYTHYVFVQQLLKQKGSDASWKNDMEVPQELMDYSDDEAESGLSELPENRKRGSLERHRQFEEDMNLRNVINTHIHLLQDRGPQHRGSSRTSSGGVGRGSNTARVGNCTHSRGSGKSARTPGSSFPYLTPPPQPPQPAAFHTAAAAAAAVSHCAYHQPPYSLAPYSMPPPLTPYIPMFMPSIPPMQFTGPPPPHVFGGMQQTKSATVGPTPAPMVYPPDMGLPPVQQNPPLVPNMQYFNPPLMWGNFATQPPPPPPAQQPVNSATGDELQRRHSAH